MRYYQADRSLIFRGAFRACSTGVDESIREVRTLMLTPPHSSDSYRPEWEIEKSALRHGLNPHTTLGLINTEDVFPLCIFKYNQITIFLSRDRQHLNQDSQGSVDRITYRPHLSIICCISEILADHTLLEILAGIQEEKTLACIHAGYQEHSIRGGVIVASEHGSVRTEVNPLPVILETIHYAISQVLDPDFFTEGKGRDEPLFFIHTTIGGDRWIRWKKGGCPYYPCHFKGQRCDLCYCPLYPCEDEQLGEWATGSRSGGKVWSCVPCTLNHQPAVVQHLRRNPEASVTELKHLLTTLSSQNQGFPSIQCG